MGVGCSVRAGIEMVEEIRLLGLVARSDLRKTSNTEEMMKKAYRKLWALRRPKGMSANVQDLKDIYNKQVRCIQT